MKWKLHHPRHLRWIGNKRRPYSRVHFWISLFSVKISYLVAGVEGLEGVSEPFVMAVLGEGGGVVGSAAHAPVPVPDEGVGDHQGDVVGVGPPTTWKFQKLKLGCSVSTNDSDWLEHNWIVQPNNTKVVAHLPVNRLPPFCTPIPSVDISVSPKAT